MKTENIIFWAASAGAVILLVYVLVKKYGKPKTTITTTPSTASSSPAPTGSSSTAGSTGSSSGVYTPDATLNTANEATKKEIQLKANVLLNHLRANGSDSRQWWSTSASLPANLVVDGVLGNNSKTVLKYIWAWYYNLNQAATAPKYTPDALNFDVLSKTAADTITKIGIVAGMNGYNA